MDSYPDESVRHVVVVYGSQSDHGHHTPVLENLICTAGGVVEIVSVTSAEVVVGALLLITKVILESTTISSLKSAQIFHSLSIHLIYTVLSPSHPLSTRHVIVIVIPFVYV